MSKGEDSKYTRNSWVHTVDCLISLDFKFQSALGLQHLYMCRKSDIDVICQN